jgi:hypothetical protein
MRLRPALSLGVSASSFRRVWMTTQVQHREDGNQVSFRGEEHSVGEVADQGAPNAFLDDWKSKRMLQESGEDRIHYASNRKPRPSRSRSYRSAASKISSSASDGTSSRHIQRTVRRWASSSSRTSDQERDVIPPRRYAARRSAMTWRCQSGIGTSSGCLAKWSQSAWMYSSFSSGDSWSKPGGEARVVP